MWLINSVSSMEMYSTRSQRHEAPGMIEAKQVVTLPPGVVIDVFHEKGNYVVRLEFPGTGADQYEAQQASAMAMADLITLLKERYERALASAGEALAKQSWDRPSRK
jgi:hypothetical protein